MKSGMRYAITTAALASFLLSGCAKISTEYGKTKGSSGRKSLNGFGALRRSYERSGFRSRDVSRLSERVMRTDVIVWTPQLLGPIDPNVTGWFERWLSRGNHTLVYIVPDSGSEADYWIDTSRLAPPEQRLEYRKRAAKSVNERISWRLNRGRVQSNGWFHVEPLVYRKKLADIRGPWKKGLPEISPDEPGASAEFLVVAFDADKDKAAAKAAAGAGAFSAGPTGPNTPGWSFPSDTKPTKTPVQFSELVRTETGETIVAEIRSKNWKDSTIIVVAGGSLLTNYAFTRTFNRALAAKIIAESKPAGDQDLRAGFLTSDWNQIAVSEKQPEAPVASGMELLTTWPMSLVTMHGVMLGLVICLMLFPIFGRPKRIQHSKRGNFGDHLDAVAALMNKAGGERYARARISEYMKRMHGESVGPWVLPDPAENSMAATPPLTSRRRGATPTSSTANLPAATTVQPTAIETEESEHDEAER